MEMLQHDVTEHNEYIPRSKLGFQNNSPEQKPSPNVVKAGGKKANQQRLVRQMQMPDQNQDTIPKLHEYGVTQAVAMHLEVSTHLPTPLNLPFEA